MEDFLIDPIQRYQYADMVDKTVRTSSGNSQEEFYKMVIEKIFLNQIMSKSAFMDEEDEADAQNNVINNSSVELMGYLAQEQIIRELSDNDAFGLLEALKQRGLSDAR